MLNSKIRPNAQLLKIGGAQYVGFMVVPQPNVLNSALHVAQCEPLAHCALLCALLQPNVLDFAAYNSALHFSPM